MRRCIGWISSAILACCVPIAFADEAPNAASGILPAAASSDARPRLVAQLGHSFPIVTMAVSPDGKLLGTGGDDGWTIVWDAATLNELCRLRDPSLDSVGKTVEEIQFSPDGRFVAASCGAILRDSVNHVWEIATERELRFHSDGEIRSTGPIRFSPDGKWCLLGADGKIWCCLLNAPDKCRAIDEENRRQITDLAISPDNRWFVAADEDGSAKIYSLVEGKLLHSLQFPDVQPKQPPPQPPPAPAAPPPPDSETFQPRAERFGSIYCAQIDEKPTEGEAPTPPSQEASQPIRAVAISPNSKRVVIGSDSGQIGCFNADSGEIEWTKNVADRIEHFEFSADGKNLIVRTAITFQILDSAKGEVIQSFERSRIPWSVFASSDGKHVLTAGQDRRVRMWEAGGGRLERVFEGARSDLHLVLMSPDGKQVLAHSTSGVLFCWNAQTGELIWKIQTQPWNEESPTPNPAGDDVETTRRVRSENNTFALQFAWPLSSFVDAPVISANGQWMSLPEGVAIVNTSDVKQLRSLTKHFEQQPTIGRIIKPRIQAISNDGNFVLLIRPAQHSIDLTSTELNSNVIEIWSMTSGKKVARLNETDSLELSAAAFSDDNTWVATGDMAGAVKLWGAANGRRYASYTGPTGNISCLRIPTGARQIVAASLDGSVYVWDRSPERLALRISDHGRGVTSVTVSPDGRYLMTTSADETARRWDMSTGKEVARYGDDRNPTVADVCFGSKGELVVVQKDGAIRVTSGVHGNVVKQFTARAAGDVMTAVALSADGRQGYVAAMNAHELDSDPDLAEELILTGLGNMPTSLSRWNIGSGVVQASVQSPQAAANLAAISAANLPLMTTHLDGKARRWGDKRATEVASGGTFGPGYPLVVSPDEQKMIVATDLIHGKAEVRDCASGKTLYHLPHTTADRLFNDMLENSAEPFHCFSSDGHWLLWPLESEPHGIAILDAATGRPVQKLSGHKDAIVTAAFSPDGKWVATVSEDQMAGIWNVATGRLEHQLRGHTAGVLTVAWQPAGELLATGGADGQIILWNSGNGKLVRRMKATSPDDASSEASARGAAANAAPQAPPAPDPAGSTEQNDEHHAFVQRLGFSPDGKRLLTETTSERSSVRGRLEMWETNSGKELVKAFKPPIDPANKNVASSNASSVNIAKTAFSPDGRRLIGWDLSNEEVLVWDTADGHLMHRLGGQAPGATAAGFLNNGKIIYTCSADGRTMLWDAEKGAELCTMIAFVDGTWAVVDPQGRFDASGGGDVEGLHWVVGNEPIELVQLKERYYEPGLLAKKLGLNKEPLRDVQAFSSPKLFPTVSITPPKTGETKFDIHLANRGGGIGPVIVLINGKKFQFPDSARGSKPDPNAAASTLTVDVAGDPRLIPGERNKIEIQAFNADGYLRSRGLELDVRDPRKKNTAPPDVWAVVVGVSHYQGGQIDLAYPAKDAEDFAAGLKVAASRLFGSERVHLTTLISPKLDAPSQPDDAHRPTRANLLAALESLKDSKRVKASDILVVYLAGHGVARGGTDDSFYYLTCDAENAQLDDSDLRRQWTISDRELTDLLERSPAQKQVMILDTCHSGKLVQDLTIKREVSSSQERALQRVKDSTGFHILAGCAADKASYETSRYGQGVLTYALLFGMRGAALKEDQFVDVGKLFAFAKQEVPQLAGDIGGVQEPVIASPKGSTFEIGQVTKEDQSKIPLQAVRPLVLRTSFHDDDELDPLGLSEQMDEVLRDVASAPRGQHPPLAFADARQLPGAYHVAGRYQVNGEHVNVSVRLAPPDGKGMQFSVEGEKSKVSELAAKICDGIEQRLASKP